MARALEAALPDPFLFFGLDFFLLGDVLPRTAGREVRDRARLRPNVHDGFYRCVRALAVGGNDVDGGALLETTVSSVVEAWQQRQT
ncbi:hypothetical protein C6I20_00700 [Aeromicrobium sp. A1-2]|nr:hypothetical protein C6I20_00700 [Aeromicrobium sp. A1-2]